MRSVAAMERGMLVVTTENVAGIGSGFRKLLIRRYIVLTIIMLRARTISVRGPIRGRVVMP